MSEDVLFTTQGHLGIITLNRPHALNALTLDMIFSLQQQLSLWKDDLSIHAVVLTAAPGNAFCAGGDVRWLYKMGKEQPADQMSFFWHEYRLNQFIYQFGKPYIALMDGITMGGGVGISLHGSHPIASDRFIFAMPETNIGFFPDIGASYLLHRCPGFLGTFLALTGNRLGPNDAKKAGLVKYLVNAPAIHDLIPALMAYDLSVNAHQQVDHCMQQFSCDYFAEQESAINPLIDKYFSGSSIEVIEQVLSNADSPWAMTIVKNLRRKSPLSLKVTLEQMHKTKNLSLAECLIIDYDLVQHFVQGHDFYEGVRALLIDKDQNPQWNPARLDLVSEAMVNRYFESTEPRP
jgi:enoyl-CoA hydratase/carnithine racemase